MKRIKVIIHKVKAFIKNLECKYDCINALIFGGGFFVGSQFTEIFGAFFMIAFWMTATFIGKKIYKNYKK